MRLWLSTFFWFAFYLVTLGQTSIGTLYFDEERVAEGYTLIYPNNQSSVYLIDHCGVVINKWELHPDSRPGSKALLDYEGNLYTCSNNFSLISGPTFGTGGSGGLIESFDWHGGLRYQFILADTLLSQHHDIELMPNGNLLILAYRFHEIDELIQLGFDTSSHIQQALYSESVLEYNPQLDSIVWAWHSADHLIQHIDPTLSNYCDPSDCVGKLDINYQDYAFQKQDFMHANSLSYSEELDMILLSVKNFNELWIIDHSTSSDEAASDTGGNSDLGGQILFRWGDDNSFKSGTADRQSFFQHDAQFYSVSDSLIEIIFFNNWPAEMESRGQLLSVPLLEGSFVFDSLLQTFLPLDFSASYVHPEKVRGFSTAGSSVQILENENILMCAARQGRLYEITQDGDLVWEYLVPLINGAPATQGDSIDLSENWNFEAKKYPKEYFNFTIEEPENGLTIELGQDESYCFIDVSTANQVQQDNLIYFDFWNRRLVNKSELLLPFEIYDAYGNKKLKSVINSEFWLPDFLPNGVYIVKLTDKTIASKILLID